MSITILSGIEMNIIQNYIAGFPKIELQKCSRIKEVGGVTFLFTIFDAVSHSQVFL